MSFDHRKTTFVGSQYLFFFFLESISSENTIDMTGLWTFSNQDIEPTFLTTTTRPRTTLFLHLLTAKTLKFNKLNKISKLSTTIRSISTRLSLPGKQSTLGSNLIPFCSSLAGMIFLATLHKKLLTRLDAWIFQIAFHISEIPSVLMVQGYLWVSPAWIDDMPIEQNRDHSFPSSKSSCVLSSGRRQERGMFRIWLASKAIKQLNYDPEVSPVWCPFRYFKCVTINRSWFRWRSWDILPGKIQRSWISKCWVQQLNLGHLVPAASSPQNLELQGQSVDTNFDRRYSSTLVW